MRLPILLALLPLPALAEVSATDATGATVTLPTLAERVACLINECSQILAALDLAPVSFGQEPDKLVAMDPRLFGDAVADVPFFTYSDGFDLEMLAALDPDLIVAWPGAVPAEVARDIAPVYVVGDAGSAATVREMGEDLLALGRLTGREDAARAFVARLEDRAEAYARLAPEAQLTVLPVNLSFPDPAQVWALPCGPLYEAIAPCVGDAADWRELTLEGVLSLDPDVLIINKEFGEATPSLELWAAEPLWGEIRAVREGRVLVVENTITGTYSAVAYDLALDRLMPLLYPDTFSAPLTDAEVAAALQK